MLKHCKLLLYLYFFIIPLYHICFIIPLYPFCDRMVSVTATELQNLFLKLTQCYCNTQQVSEPEVGRFLYFDCKTHVFVYSTDMMHHSKHIVVKISLSLLAFSLDICQNKRPPTPPPPSDICPPPKQKYENPYALYCPAK